MVAGCAALDLLDTAEYTRLNNLAVQLGRGLESALHMDGLPCQVNVAGSLFQVHLRADPVTDYRSLATDPGARTRGKNFAAELLKRGIVLSPNGLGCISSAMGSAEIAEFVAAAADAAAAVDFPTPYR
jgi:glutamate-1-semialdehyde 2,1-aminomutase